jgi:hypothetical protein
MRISEIPSTVTQVSPDAWVEIEQDGASAKASARALQRAGLVAPVLTDFTTTALTATISQSPTGVLFDAAAAITSGDIWPRILKAPPAEPFTVTAHYNGNRFNGNFTATALLLQDSTNKMVTCEALFVTTSPVVEMNIWTSPSAYSSTPGSLTANDRYFEWLRLHVTSTTITASVSLEGTAWRSFASTARSSLGATLTGVGFGVKPNGSTTSNWVIANLDHFEVT